MQRYIRVTDIPDETLLVIKSSMSIIAGIVAYFATPFILERVLVFFAASLVIASVILCIKKVRVFFLKKLLPNSDLIITLFFFALGILLIKARISYREAQIQQSYSHSTSYLTSKTKPQSNPSNQKSNKAKIGSLLSDSSGRLVKITGFIEERMDRPTLIKTVVRSHHSGSTTRYRISSTQKHNAVPGDFVDFYAVMINKPSLVTPNGHDQSMFDFFQGIVGSGFSVRAPKIDSSKSGKGLFANIASIRHSVYNKINASVKSPYSSIVSALIIGKKDSIPKKNLDEIRKAGIAHLLAISGLHIASISMLIFTFSRFILSRFEYLTLNFNIKKISAVVSATFSFFYLIISGSPISAQRAFAMIFMYMLGIMIGKRSIALHILSITACVILFFQPEAVLKPSFQMSFSAVLFLCLTKITVIKNTSEQLYSCNKTGPVQTAKLFLYSLMLGSCDIISSSTIATLATAPFTLYHFNYLPLAGLLSNIFAIPLTVVLIIPISILALFIPTHTYIASFLWGIDEHLIKLLLYIAENFSNYSWLSAHISSISKVSLFLITFGAILFCTHLHKYKKLAHASLIVMSLGIALTFINKSPDAFLYGKKSAFREKSGLIYFTHPSHRGSFVKESIVSQNGQDIILTSKDLPVKNSSLECDSSGETCTYKRSGIVITIEGEKVKIVRGGSTLEIDNTERCGPYFVWITEKDKVKVRSTDSNLLRPWNIHRTNMGCDFINREI